MESAENKITLRFSGRIADDHKVPASVLNQVLMGLQRAIYLLALKHEGIDVRQRDKVPGKIEDKYSLLCEAPKQGSLEIYTTFGNPNADIMAPIFIERVGTDLINFYEALQKREEEKVREIMPDRTRRKGLIEAISKTVPKGGTGIKVQAKFNDKIFLVSERLSPAINEFTSKSSSSEELSTVTGRLIRIDFEERKVTIHYKPTGKELECFYEESVEEMLLQRPRELIQVTGVIRMDENGAPKKIVDVEKIHELDLSFFHRDIINTIGLSLKFKKSLELEPILVEEEQVLWLNNIELGIDVIATTIEELSESLDEEIVMLWRTYAIADDSELSPKAIELKNSLLNAIEEVKING